jgi:putative transposase
MSFIYCVPKGYLSSRTSVHFMGYHFVWCPKYRRKVLVGKIESRLKNLIQEKVAELDCKILALEVMPDHVHLFVQAPSTIAPNRIIAPIKGYTSHELRKEFPELKQRLPTLWTRSYFVSSHVNITATAVKTYVEEQKGI